MGTKEECEVCKESLDDRDIVKGFLSCWKCGWKKKIVVKFTDDEFDDFLDDYGSYFPDFYTD